MTRHVFLSAVLLCSYGVGMVAQRAQAQVIGDSTLQNQTRVTRDRNLFRITAGTRSGSYLFHSFQDFSLSQAQTARFINPAGTRGVIARVTGGNPSQLNGIIQSTGRADVFFLNPSGINFGRRAQLQVGGSFLASTAEQIQFDNGTRLSVRPNTSAPPLLKISTPTGIQFGARPTPITVSGPGHGLVIDPDTLATIPQNRPTELLQLQPMNSLALIGSDIILSGGNLQASGGRVYLGALGPNQFLPLTSDSLGWTPSQFEATSPLGDILLENSASAITNGNGGGEIQIHGHFVDILDGSTLLATSFGTRSGRGVTIEASGGSLISGVAIDPRTGDELFPSSIFAEVGFAQDSNGGSITLRMPQLELSEGGQVSTTTFGTGQGGNIEVVADRVDVLGGTETFGASGFYLDVFDERTEGKGGNFDLQTKRLDISNGGTISASTFGPGNAGLIDIQANRLVLQGGAPGLGASSILAQVEDSGSSAGIRIVSDRTSVLGGAQISTSTFGSGNGGSLRLNSSQIRLEGSSPAGNPGGLFSIVERPGTGSGGQIRVIADALVLRNGAEINSSTRFRGNAGNLFISAQDIDINDRLGLSTGLFSAVEQDATGTGATLTVNAQNLSVTQGGQIVSGTLGRGDAGNIVINADRIDLADQSDRASSGILASAIDGTGRGGDIQLRSNFLSVRNGATINVSNFSSDNSNLLPGRGAAGSIQIDSADIYLQNQGSINASTAVGNRGNLLLESERIFLGNRSSIQTNTTSTTGGNITISTQQLFALGNSDITANAVQGLGGRVNITANQVFGIAPRSQLSPMSDITASSALGPQFTGTVEVNILEPSPTGEQVLGVNDVIDASQLIARSCFQRLASKQGRFVLKGSGGLAARPYEATSPFFNTLNLDTIRETQSQHQTQQPRAIEPGLRLNDASLFNANQWINLPNGKLALGRVC